MSNMPTVIPEPRVIYLHGLEGSPNGRKATAIREAGAPLVAPDLSGLTLSQRIRQVEWLLAEHHSSLLVGSSYGGLAALYLANEHRHRFFALVLYAPALLVAEPPIENVAELVVPTGLRTIIVHGKNDTVVPIDVSRELVARSGGHVKLWEVDDDHRLTNSLEDIVEAVRQTWNAVIPHRPL